MLIPVENCRLYGFADPGLRNSYCNLHAVVSNHGIDLTQYSSGTLFQHFGLPLDKDKAHNTVWDVQSLLASMNAMTDDNQTPNTRGQQEFVVLRVSLSIRQ